MFQLCPKDPLPKTVCLDCCTKLNQCSEFFETTTQAQVTLHMIFPGTKKEEELETEEQRPELEHEQDHDSSSFLEEVRSFFKCRLSVLCMLCVQLLHILMQQNSGPTYSSYMT